MKTTLCYLSPFPDDLKEKRSAWIKGHLRKALDKGLTPALLPAEGLERLTVAIPPDMAARISRLAAEHAVADGRMIGMLVLASINLARVVQPPKGSDGPVSPSGDRPEQVQLLDAAMPLLLAGKIAIAEIGTGVGKSRIAGRIAQELWRKNGPQVPVIVATPTVAQIAHLARELRSLEKSSDVKLPKPTYVLGRAQFIDLEEALEMAYASDNASAVAWIESGAPAGLTEASTDFACFVPEICGLMEDWQFVMSATTGEGNFDPADCVLHEDSSNESLAAYQRLRASAHESPLILCTHAMVGVDLQARRCIRKLESIDNSDEAALTILPSGACYIIDEAHLFEQELANVASQSVSLHSLAKLLRDDRWANFRVAGACRAAASAAESLISVLRPIGGVSNRSVLLPANLQDPAVAYIWASALADLDSLHQALGLIIKKLSAKEFGAQTTWGLGQTALNRAKRAIYTAIMGKHVVEVTTSPVRRFAALTTGPATVNWLTSLLWAECHSAVVMSGTLLLPSLRGFTSAYIREMLNLPDERAIQLPSIHPRWTLSTPQVFLPAGPTKAWLTPPSTESATQEQMTAWMQHVANVVVMAADSAAGGTMVLLSGYDRIELLNGALPAEFAGRLIAQGRSGPNLLVCQQRFRAMHAQGLRPIWLATGGAWTGLDLRDRTVPDGQAAKDLLLTDVIIPNVPFGLNRSTTHASRCRRLIKFEAMSAALLLRQGMGRLVRREGLKNRRLWVLDGRMLTQDAARGSSMYLQSALMLELFNQWDGQHQVFRLRGV